MKLASELRAQGLRVGTYLGSSGKLGKQLQWANAQNARFAVIFGSEEQESGEVTVRDMVSGDQDRIPLAQASADLQGRLER